MMREKKIGETELNKDIEKLIKETVNRNSLVKINDKLYLKQYQVEVLEYYHIDYKNVSSLSEILLLIEEVLETDNSIEKDTLEEVALSLQEFQYYHNTNK